MASPSELSLEYKPHLNTYSMLLKSFGDHQQATDQTQRLEEVLARLEEERLKIEVFKRELPLCMQLLTNAVETSRQQLQASRSANQGPRPVLEEFIPLKNSAPETSDKCSKTYCDKANWMTSAQLWSQAAATDHIHATKPESTITSPTPCKENDASIGFNVLSPNLTLDPKPRNGGGGAFLPFSKEQQRNATLRSLGDLALASSDKETDYQVKANKICTTGTENENNNNGIRESSSAAVAAAKVANNEQGKESNSSITTTQTAHRKARRCWSPDLHRRFVNALQMLGGSQVATPKQIRELMKVDGLTNDEVKSHLQKFRLHTRRPSPSPQAVGAPAPQLVVLGGIWVPPEYATAAHNGAPPLYGASPASHPPPHFCAPVPPGTQDFYTAATPTTAPHHHYHHHQHQLHMYNATSQTNQSLPESDVRGAGERSESVEDGKSESGSWKAESGENGSGERRGLAALRVDGDASEITLKF